MTTFTLLTGQQPHPLHVGYWTHSVQISGRNHFYWYTVTSSADRRSYTGTGQVVNSDPVARMTVRVDSVKDLQGNPVSPQIYSYTAWLHYGSTDNGVQVLAITGMAPYTVGQTDIKNDVGITYYTQQPPVAPAAVALRLRGSKDTPYYLALDYEEVLPPGSTQDIPQSAPSGTVTRVLRRGGTPRPTAL